MNVIVKIVASVGMLSALGSAIYIFYSNKIVQKMQITNRGVGEYVKSKDFLLMKNGGDHPCDTKEKFSMPSFSQEGNYIMRRKSS